MTAEGSLTHMSGNRCCLSADRYPSQNTSMMWSLRVASWASLQHGGWVS